MRHLKKGKKLKRTSSHRKALLRNLAIALLEHKKIVTTVAKAKALRPFVEKIITRAKRAVLREKNGQLPEGQTVDVHSRRIVGRLIHNKAVLQELFDTIAPTVLDRPGGYTRIVKLGFRRGDAAEIAAIELVDWGAPQDGAVSLKSKKKAATKKKPATRKAKKEEKVVAEEAQQVQTTESSAAEEQKTLESEAPEVAQAEQVSEPSTDTTESAAVENMSAEAKEAEIESKEKPNTDPEK
jgi:large subunit ribosomal protein L17